MTCCVNISYIRSWTNRRQQALEILDVSPLSGPAFSSTKYISLFASYSSSSQRSPAEILSLQTCSWMAVSGLGCVHVFQGSQSPCVQHACNANITTGSAQLWQVGRCFWDTLCMSWASRWSPSPPSTERILRPLS